MRNGNPEAARSLSKVDQSNLTKSHPVRLSRNHVARLFDRTIFVSLFALIVLSAIPYGTVHPWWVALFQCAAFALAVLWIIEGLLSGSVLIVL